MTEMKNSKTLETMSLDELRGEINRIDEDLVRVLSARVATAVKIGETKIRSKAPFLNERREQEVLERVRSIYDGPMDDDSLVSIYKEIIRACTKVQERTVIVMPDDDQQL